MIGSIDLVAEIAHSIESGFYQGHAKTTYAARGTHVHSTVLELSSY